MTTRTLTEADLEALAERIAAKLREPPRRERRRRVASPEAHERVAAKNRRYSRGPR